MGNEQMGNRGTFVHSSDMIFTLYNRLYNTHFERNKHRVDPVILNEAKCLKLR